MSEQQPEGFEPLHPVLVEPEVAVVFNLAAEYQRELNLNPDTPAERKNEIIHHLDAMWPHNEEMVYATGTFRGPGYEVVDEGEESEETGNRRYNVLIKSREDAAEPSMEDYFADEQPLTSIGFSMEREPHVVGGIEIGTHEVIKMLFRRTHDVPLPDGEHQYTITDGVMCLPDQVSLEFSRDTPELCEAICLDYFPEATEQLLSLAGDEMLTGSEKILELRDLTIPSPDYITTREVEALSQFALDCLEIEYETKPYYLEASDNALLFSPDDNGMDCHHSLDSNLQLVDILGIRSHQAVVAEYDEKNNGYTLIPQPNQLELRLAVRVLQESSERDSEELELCIKDLVSLRNVRDVLNTVEYTDDERDEA